MVSGARTPGTAGNSILSRGTSVLSASRGCALGGGAALSRTQRSIATSSARPAPAYSLPFVGVEPWEEKWPEQAPVLGGTEGISLRCRNRPALLVFHRRCHVAQCRKSQARNDGALGLVTQLIKMAWLVAALEIERGNI